MKVVFCSSKVVFKSTCFVFKVVFWGVGYIRMGSKAHAWGHSQQKITYLPGPFLVGRCGPEHRSPLSPSLLVLVSSFVSGLLPAASPSHTPILPPLPSPVSPFPFGAFSCFAFFLSLLSFIRLFFLPPPFCFLHSTQLRATHFNMLLSFLRIAWQCKLALQAANQEGRQS